jgi:hypothetical protein
MATTTNYAWETPDDTDLVKDGAAAIRTLGSSIDTTTKALNPSTTLGDIEYRSATANTNTRLPIGTAGQVLTVNGGVPSWQATGSPSFNTGYNFVSTGQSTSSSTFTDLATVQSVTVTTGTKVLVTITATYENSTAARQAQISFAVTGASSLAASIARGAETSTQNGGTLYQTLCYTSVITGLTAGSNVFTMKFASPTADSAYFRDRTISVVNLGS